MKKARRRRVNAAWGKTQQESGRSAKKQIAYRRKKVAKVLLHAARCRAKRYGLPFSITESDVVVPASCPVLGIPLAVGAGRCGAGSPTLDRIIPARGYVTGNVVVVSHRANTIKSDASVAELAYVLRYYSRLIGKALK